MDGLAAVLCVFLQSLVVGASAAAEDGVLSEKRTQKNAQPKRPCAKA